MKGIEIALVFYESDLAFQRRAGSGKDTVVLDFGALATLYGQTMLVSIQNIVDASAQYRLMYKTLEMINWDFSRDQHAKEISDTIVDINQTLTMMDEQPSRDDQENVKSVRRLSGFIDQIRISSQLLNVVKSRNGSIPFTSKIELKAGMDAIHQVDGKQIPVTFLQSYGDVYVVKYQDNSVHVIKPEEFLLSKGCIEEICVGEKAMLPSDATYVTVLFISAAGGVFYVVDERDQAGKKRWGNRSTLAKTKGFSQDLSIGSTVKDKDDSSIVGKIIAITADGKYIVETNGGLYRSSYRYTGYERERLEKLLP